MTTATRTRPQAIHLTAAAEAREHQSDDWAQADAERDLAFALEERESAELIVIDTPPHADLAASKAAECADLVLIPCRPSAFDLAAMRTTLPSARRSTPPGFGDLLARTWASARVGAGSARVSAGPSAGAA